MTRHEIDMLDLGALVVFVFGSIGSYGWLTFELFGIGLQDVLLEFSADGYMTQFTIGTALMLFAIGMVFFTNDISWNYWSAMQLWMAVAVIWLTLSPPFVPIMNDLVTQNELGSVVAFSIQSGGLTALIYEG